MESNKSLPLKGLKAVLKKLLKKYEDVEDIIIFGSFVKSRYNPKDIDIALIMYKKNYDAARDIQQKTKSKVNIPIHTTVVLFKELYTEPIWKSLIMEGFSIKKNKFLKDVIKIKS